MNVPPRVEWKIGQRNEGTWVKKCTPVCGRQTRVFAGYKIIYKRKIRTRYGTRKLKGVCINVSQPLSTNINLDYYRVTPILQLAAFEWFWQRGLNVLMPRVGG